MPYLELEDIEDGDECLCVNDGRIVSQPCDDGGLHVVSRTIHHLATKTNSDIPTFQLLFDSYCVH